MNLQPGIILNPTEFMDKKNLGARGEKIACDFLIAKGYQILETNWRSKRNEIDIIAEINNILVFIEVKTRTGDVYGNPEEAVNEVKKDHIYQAAEDYMFIHNVKKEIRFDIISIILVNQTEKIFHIEDAL
jgi:putative endonuclease